MLFVAFLPNEQEIHCTSTFNFASLWAVLSLGACRGNLKHNLDFSCNAEIQLLLVSLHATFTYTLAFIWLLKTPFGASFGCCLQNTAQKAERTITYIREGIFHPFLRRWEECLTPRDGWYLCANPYCYSKSAVVMQDTLQAHLLILVFRMAQAIWESGKSFLNVKIDDAQVWPHSSATQISLQQLQAGIGEQQPKKSGLQH